MCLNSVRMTDIDCVNSAICIAGRISLDTGLMKVYESVGKRSLQYVWQPVGRKKSTEVHSRGCFEILRV